MKFSNHYPSAITIEIMDVCNLKCKHCYLYVTPEPRTGFMDYSFFERLVTRISPLIKQAEQVNFSSVEALFHPQIFEMIDLVRKQNRYITFRINTNGLFLNDKNIDRLMERAIYNFGFSLNGCSRGTAQLFEPRIDFDRVVDNLRKLSIVAKEIEMKFIVHRGNVGEVMEYIDFCHGLGIKAIHMSGLISFTTEIAPYCLYSETGLKEIDELYHGASQKAKGLGIKLRHLGTRLRPIGCRTVQRTMYIGQEGNVNPCVYLSQKIPIVLLNKVGIQKKIVWGNVFEEDPYEIWTGEASTQFRGLAHSGKLPSQCKLCAQGYKVIC